MEFIRLSTEELRQSITTDFNICSTENKIAVNNPISGEITLLELTYNGEAQTMPYEVSKLRVPQTNPIKEIVNSVNFPQIYEKCDVLEQEDLTLEPIYMRDYSEDLPKAQLVKAIYAPSSAETSSKPNDENLLAVVTTFGACFVYKKARTVRRWQHRIGDINQMLKRYVFPMLTRPGDIDDYQKLKKSLNQYFVTACSWHENGKILYIANAAGSLVGLRLRNPLENRVDEFNDSAEFSENIDPALVEKFKMEFELLSILPTNMGYITYIQCFKNFLFVCNRKGCMRLYKLIKADLTSRQGTSAIAEMDALWNSEDDMPIRKIETFLMQDTLCAVFAKGSNVVAVQFSAEGKQLSYQVELVNGITITGLEKLSDSELVVTTITGNIFCIRLTLSENRKKDENSLPKLNIDQFPIPIRRWKNEHYQIAGIASSVNRSLWTIMLCRNKAYGTYRMQFLNVGKMLICKFRHVELLEYLLKTPVRLMDDYLDYYIGLRLEIWAGTNAEQTCQFYTLNEDILTEEFNDEYLQRLQLRLLMMRASMFRLSVLINLDSKRKTEELEFLKDCIMLTHILCRLRYLLSLVDQSGDAQTFLTGFQRLSLDCMQNQFRILINKMKRKAVINLAYEYNTEICELAKKFITNANRAIFILSATNDLITVVVDDDYNEIEMEISAEADSDTSQLENANKTPTRKSIESTLSRTQNADDVEMLNVENPNRTRADTRILPLNESTGVFEETCWYCDKPINMETLVCANNHAVNRCSVSQTMLPFMDYNRCQLCKSFCLEDLDLLQTLFEPQERVKCTFCRCEFIPVSSFDLLT